MKFNLNLNKFSLKAVKRVSIHKMHNLLQNDWILFSCDADIFCHNHFSEFANFNKMFEKYVCLFIEGLANFTTSSKSARLFSGLGGPVYFWQNQDIKK